MMYFLIKYVSFVFSRIGITAVTVICEKISCKEEYTYFGFHTLMPLFDYLHAYETVFVETLSVFFNNKRNSLKKVQIYSKIRGRLNTNLSSFNRIF